MMTQVSLFCLKLCGDTQYVMGSPCIDLWRTSPTFCYKEHFEEVHTTHTQHTNYTKLPCPPPIKLPGFAVTAPSTTRTGSMGPISCAMCPTQSARQWLPHPLLLWCRWWHLRHRQSLHTNAGRRTPRTPPASFLTYSGLLRVIGGAAARSTRCAAAKSSRKKLLSASARRGSSCQTTLPARGRQGRRPPSP